MTDNLSSSTGGISTTPPQYQRTQSKKKFNIFHLHSNSTPNLKLIYQQQLQQQQQSPKNKDDISLNSSSSSVSSSGGKKELASSASNVLNTSYGSDYSGSPHRSPPNSPRSDNENDGADYPLSKSTDSSPNNPQSNKKKPSRFAAAIRRVKNTNKLKKEIAEMQAKSGLTQQYTKENLPFNEIPKSEPSLSTVSSYDSSNNLKRYGSQRKSRFIESIDGSTEDYTDIPKTIKLSIEFLFEKALKVPGLFRESANSLELQRLKQALASNEEVDLSDYKEPHNIAGLLKQYLRERSSPIFPYNLHKQISDLYESDIKNQQSISAQLKDLLKIELSKGQFLILRYLFELLHAVSLNEEYNKMSSYNLAVCFAPTLIHSFDCSCIEVVDKLIEDYEIIFGIDVPVVPTEDPSSTSLESSSETSTTSTTSRPVSGTATRRRKRSNTRMVRLSVLFEEQKKMGERMGKSRSVDRPMSWQSDENDQQANDTDQSEINQTRNQRCMSNDNADVYSQADVNSIFNNLKSLKDQKSTSTTSTTTNSEQAEVALLISKEGSPEYLDDDDDDEEEELKVIAELDGMEDEEEEEEIDSDDNVNNNCNISNITSDLSKVNVNGNDKGINNCNIRRNSSGSNNRYANSIVDNSSNPGVKLVLNSIEPVKPSTVQYNFSSGNNKSKVTYHNVRNFSVPSKHSTNTPHHHIKTHQIGNNRSKSPTQTYLKKPTLNISRSLTSPSLPQFTTHHSKSTTTTSTSKPTVTKQVSSQHLPSTLSHITRGNVITNNHDSVKNLTNLWENRIE